jgi:hypothetical protein
MSIPIRRATLKKLREEGRLIPLWVTASTPLWRSVPRKTPFKGYYRRPQYIYQSRDGTWRMTCGCWTGQLGNAFQRLGDHYTHFAQNQSREILAKVECLFALQRFAARQTKRSRR